MYGREWLEEREIRAAVATVLAALDAVPAEHREEVRRRIAPAPSVMQAQFDAMRQLNSPSPLLYAYRSPTPPGIEPLFGFRL